ncbi:MAG: phenylalanine--tRNA ligase subunit alpha [Planctomycetota bacterium]|nr:phenylalanine--tRNA ligase subunit alpha [Planctomycetota bacterium]
MELLEEIAGLASAARAALEQADSVEALDRARNLYLGRAGKWRDLMARIREVPAAERQIVGKRLNEVKDDLTAAFAARRELLVRQRPSGPLPDLTLPGQCQPRGAKHPLTQTVERICEIFERLGFTVADGPEIEDEFHNFDALNIPADHPARDMADTFFLSNGRMLRSQTSTVQIRVMEKTKPPLRVIAPGRVYRPDTVDATHFYSFSQVEGLAVDTAIAFADLKGILSIFAQEMFGAETRTRFRPSFFPFTEPSAEMDVTCIFCGGSGCGRCKGTGWIEILGCGMVDPNVFSAVGYDPEAYTGFAFGMGVERIAMLTTGVNDIRLFTENDLRFLRQFR